MNTLFSLVLGWNRMRIEYLVSTALIIIVVTVFMIFSIV